MFVEGVTESLTTDLSRINNAFVVSRNTAFTYKGKPVDAKQIGRDLNVRYILEGSIQRGGTECASTSSSSTQSPETTYGRIGSTSRWPTRSTCRMKLSPSSPINCARSCSPRKPGAPSRRQTPISIDLYFQGVQWFNKGGPDNIERARGNFERAVALDPTNVDALVGAARADVLVGAIYTTDAPDRAPGRRRGAADQGRLDRAAQLLGASWLGFIQIQTNRASRAIGELEQALGLNRNLGAAHAWIGQAKITMGRAEEAEDHVNEAFRLSPDDAVGFMWTHIRGLAKLHLGADEEAAALFRRSVDASRNYPLNHFYMAAALAHLGRLDEARAEVKAGLALAPKYSIARFQSMAESDNPTYLKQRERILEGLRKAGVPEKLRIGGDG